jgi:hypothetical protein
MTKVAQEGADARVGIEAHAQNAANTTITASTGFLGKVKGLFSGSNSTVTTSILGSVGSLLLTSFASEA